MRSATDVDDAAAIILKSDAYTLPCAYCGVPMSYDDQKTYPTRDHVWPKDLRSIDAGRIGTVWCCHGCNMRKGNKSPSHWLSEMPSEFRMTDGSSVQQSYDAAPKVVQAQVDALLGLSVRKGDREGAGYPWTAKPDSTLPPLGGSVCECGMPGPCMSGDCKSILTGGQ